MPSWIQNKRVRFLVILLLFVTSILLPVWWNTTGAYQTPIPHDSIAHITNSSSTVLYLVSILQGWLFILKTV